MRLVCFIRSIRPNVALGHSRPGQSGPPGLVRCYSNGGHLVLWYRVHCPEIQCPCSIRGDLVDGMNWSMQTANRTTHLKIVVVGLAGALMIALIGISARELNLGTDIMTAQTPTVIKAGGPVVFTDRSGPVVR